MGTVHSLVEPMERAGEEYCISHVSLPVSFGRTKINLQEQDLPDTPKLWKKEKYEVLEHKGILLPVVKSFTWDTKLLEQVIHKKEYLKKLTSTESVLEDNTILNDMILAAKRGDWGNVFSVLDRKPYLINAIPTERAWSALHQAVYLQNETSIQKLLAYKTCDPNIRAKRDRANKGEPGDTPLMLAKKYSSPTIINMFSETQCDLASYGPPTFVNANIGEIFIKEGVPFLLLATAFMSNERVKSLNIAGNRSFFQLTKKIYEMITTDWEYARNTLAESLYPFSKDLFDGLQAVSNCNDFCKKVIAIYTESSIYRHVNNALRRASEKLEPTGDDLLFSLFCIFLQSVLLHWNGLQKFSGTTYRGMPLCEDELKKYKKGTKFVWLSFTSTSADSATAKQFSGSKIMFVMKNPHYCSSRPRDIKQHSMHYEECEVLYPAGTEYLVKDVVEKGNGFVEIHLELCDVL